jgi:hypothetical protein
MVKGDGRRTFNMERLLDELFEGVRHGGDHETRKHVAKKLMQSAKKANVSLEELRAAGREALRHYRPGDQLDISRNNTLRRSGRKYEPETALIAAITTLDR